METHFIDWQTEGRRLARARCGQLVDRSTHSNEPTCQTCKDSRDADEQVDVEAMFGSDHGGAPVPHKPFNPTEGYRPKGLR